MAETRLWQKVLKPLMPRGKFTRIENAEAGPGTPDVHYRLTETDGWLELKDARHPNSDVPFPNENVGLHKTQLHWLKEYISYGGLAWIVARVGKRIFWIHGRHFSAFNGATMKRLHALSAYVMDQDSPDVRKIKKLLQGEDR